MMSLHGQPSSSRSREHTLQHAQGGDRIEAMREAHVSVQENVKLNKTRPYMTILQYVDDGM